MRRYLWSGLVVGTLLAGLVVWSAVPTRDSTPTAAPSSPARVRVRQPQRAVRVRQGARAAKATSHVTKVLTIVEENHSLAQMRSGMPYLYYLARHYAYARNYRAIRHPSLPNYLAIAGGDTFGVRDDANPSAHRLRGPSVFGQAIAKRRHARLYAESMPRRCGLTGDTHRGYAVKHNPWAYFAAERARCRSFDVSDTSFRRAARASALPQIAMLIPNKCDDAHDCRLSSADRWLRSRVAAALASRDFRTGRLAVVITADEDDRHSGNRVLTVVLHARLANSRKVVSTPLNHYSLSRLLSQTVGARPLRRAARAHSLSAAFGLRVGP